MQNFINQTKDLSFNAKSMFRQNLIKAKQQAMIKTLDMQTSLHVKSARSFSIGFCTNYLCAALGLDIDNKSSWR